MRNVLCVDTSLLGNQSFLAPYPALASFLTGTSGRHGILAESIVLDSESAEGFSDVLTTLQEELQPVTSIETRRQEAVDLNLNIGGANDDDATEVSPIRYTALAFRAMSDESRAQELLNRYESRYDRQYQRALNGFRAYRADSRKDEKEARRAQRTKNSKEHK